MRHLMMATLIASLLAGCGSAPTAPRATARQKAPVTQPVVQLIPGATEPRLTVVASADVAPSALAASQDAAAELVSADSNIDAIELLIQDGGAYFVQGWFSDLVDKVKNTWTRWKLSRAVKQALKHNQDKAFELHEGEIDNQRKNRTAPVTHINNLTEGAKEIISTWSSTEGGTFDIETRREVDQEGVTQTLSVSIKGKDSHGLGIDMKRIRTLTGEDGTYKVATRRVTTYKDNRTSTQEWLKQVFADASESLNGFIIHPDGHRTEFKGTRDAAGKVRVEVTKVTPATP